jgi:hypothetical protein
MSFCRTRTEDVADALLAVAWHMRIVATEMQLLGGTAAQKSKELVGAAQIALEWERVIRDGDNAEIGDSPSD